MANKGLGRGFASLMGLNDIDDFTQPSQTVPAENIETPNTNDGVVNISLLDIDPNYEQPRKNFDEDALAELADSIKLHGVIQPIVVTPIGKRFMIIAGERRFRASKLAGKRDIPAIIRHYTPQQIKEISLIENLQREDLSPIEAARAIRTLMTEFNMTQEVAADRIGKSRSAVANTLRLLTLSDDVIALIEQGRLSANPKPEKQKPVMQESKELVSLVGNMQRAFATKVSALGNGNKGRIYIDYYTADDLDRICNLVEDWMSDKFRKNAE